MTLKIATELAILIISALYLWLASRLPFGNMTQIGPGFFPVMMGCLGILITLYMLFQSYKERVKENEKEGSLSRDNLKKLAVYTVTFILFIIFFDILGALLCVFALTAITAKLYGMGGWLKPLITAAITTVLIYLVFVQWFMVPLPRFLS